MAFAGLETSLFERLVGKTGINLRLLRRQYRMHPTISWWPNQAFYQGELEDDHSTHGHRLVRGFPWPSGDAVALVDVQGQEEAYSTSWSNAAEAAVVEQIID